MKQPEKFSFRKLCKYMLYTAAIIVCSYVAGLGIGWLILKIVNL